MTANLDSDRGFYAVWYDLGDRPEEHLSWLHERYIPKLLRQERTRWAAHYRREPGIQKTSTRTQSLHAREGSVPTGQDYILIVGTDDASVFGRLFALLKQGDGREDAEFLAQRRNARMSTATQIRKWTGSELSTYPDGETPGPCIQFGNYVCPLEHREGLIEWYETDWMPNFAVHPAVLRARTLSRVTGWASHLVFYEFTSLEGRQAAFRAHVAANPSYVAPVSARQLIHAPDSPSVATRIWPVPK